MESSQASIKALFVGVDPTVAEFSIGTVKPSNTTFIQNTDAFSALLDQPDIGEFQIAIAGPLLDGLAAIEIAQSIKAIAPSMPVYYCHNSRDSGYDRKTFIKNGFTDAFLIPFDVESFRETLEEVTALLKSIPVFRSVRVLDIAPETELPFDLHIFLPRNQKYVQYSRAGRPLDLARVEKLVNHHVGAVFVPIDQMSKFYEYTAGKLKALKGGGSGLSETERRSQLQSSIRGLLTDIFATSGKSDYHEGKQMLNDAGEIVKSFMQIGDDGDLYSKILRIIGDVSSSYSHLSNVSTFASLFSMATGIGEPEELALAGLFHDLGLSSVPYEIQTKDPVGWTEDERKIYERHPEYSLNLIKEKKVVLPTNVQAIILQHHERIDGTGYPQQLTGQKIRQDAQLLAVADRFDELTQAEWGQEKLSPDEAMRKIQSEGTVSPLILEKLANLFKPAEKKAS